MSILSMLCCILINTLYHFNQYTAMSFIKNEKCTIIYDVSLSAEAKRHALLD